jgi:hypothetical protein
MIDKETARKLAYKYLNSTNPHVKDEIIIRDEYTIEKEYGWIFRYNTKTYIETGDYGKSLIGGGPLIVEKSDGSLEMLGSAYSPEDQIRWYEERRGHRQKGT